MLIAGVIGMPEFLRRRLHPFVRPTVRKSIALESGVVLAFHAALLLLALFHPAFWSIFVGQVVGHCNFGRVLAPETQWAAARRQYLGENSEHGHPSLGQGFYVEHVPSRGAPRISRGSLSYHSTLTHDGSSLIIANGDDASMDLYMLSADDLSIQNRHSATPSPDYDERIGTHFSYCRNELVCGTRTGDFEWKPAPKRAFKVND